jgi:gentisate 1,2-dioxygenase
MAMTAHGSNEQRALLEELYQNMAPDGLTPLWEVLHALVQDEPRSPAVVHKWSYARVREFLMRAGDIISAEQAERRVLILENPGMPGQSAITPSLYAGMQLILPGEIAPCHRHAQCALRFVMEGEGAYTTVDGEKAVMHPFDLVLTPGMQWHDHANPTDKPMIWLDGLDIPTVRLFDASFAERLGDKVHAETVPPGDSLRRYGANMRPMRGSIADRRPAHQPLLPPLRSTHTLAMRWSSSIRPMADRSCRPFRPMSDSCLKASRASRGNRPTALSSWSSRAKEVQRSTAWNTASPSAMYWPYLRGTKFGFRPERI